MSIRMFNPSAMSTGPDTLKAEYPASPSAANDVEETPAQLQAAIAERKNRIFSNPTTQIFLDQQTKFQKLPMAIRLAAIRRLRTLAEPEINAASNKQVPIASLGEAGRGALALLVMADCIDGVDSLVSRQVPGYVRNLNSSALAGGLNKTQAGKPIFTLTLTAPHEQSGFYEEVQTTSDYIR